MIREPLKFLQIALKFQQICSRVENDHLKAMVARFIQT